MKPEMNVESGEAAAAAAVFYVPIEDNLLELPPAKATLTKFPPGVPILYTDTSIDPLEVSRGVVESVFIDLSPEKSTRDYFYRVSLQNVKTLMVGETQLQWAPGATVWMKPLQRKKDIEWEVGTVVGSYQETCNAEPEFSIRMGEKGFFHGVNGDCLRYRQPESDLPAMKTETIVASVLPQETSVLAEPKARSEGALESPTSVVDSLHTAIQQSLLSQTDPPPLTNSSLRQSIAAKNRALSQAKRLSPSNESLLSRTDPLPLANSSSPQSIAGKNRALSQAKRLSPSNEHVAEVNASASDFEDKHVPRPKKAKVVNAHSHEESKIDHNSIIPKIPSQFSATPASNPMAYKTPSTKVSLDAPIPRKASVTGSRVNQGDPIHYGDYKESQVPAMTPIQPAYEHSQPVRNAADYASSVDSLEGNNCKVVIKVPSFANSIAVREAIIGEGGRNHKRLLRETQSRRISLMGHNMQPPCMQVEVITDSDNIDDAREIIEDAIISTVSVDERPRMLYYLAKDNEYGASGGPARYQRSPSDPQEWRWLAVIETPPGFERLTGLFMDKNAKALKQIIAQSGVMVINISNGLPKYVYILAEDPDMVNHAADLVKGRIQWTMKNS
jgi:hypothetical protein